MDLLFPVFPPALKMHLHDSNPWNGILCRAARARQQVCRNGCSAKFSALTLKGN